MKPVLTIITLSVATLAGFYIRQQRRKAHQISVCELSLDECRHTFETIHWIALCGTIFDVTHDPFFNRPDGLYHSWVGHDVTAMLLSSSVLDGNDFTNEMDSDVKITSVDITSPLDSIRQRRHVLDEWYTRLYSRYMVIGQITDRMSGKEWDSLRLELLPTSSSKLLTRCPLGFGSSSVVTRQTPLEEKDSDSSREIVFQGCKYNITGSTLFDGETAPLSHFVGHDVTYALSIHSTRKEDLDVEMKSCTYEQQVCLEQYRILFSTELRMIKSPSRVATVDLHELLDNNHIQELRSILTNPTSQLDINVVDSRTTMTLLHKAVEKNSLELVKILVSAGADLSIEAMLYDGDTPLKLAQRFQYNEIIQYLQIH